MPTVNPPLSVHVSAQYELRGLVQTPEGHTAVAAGVLERHPGAAEEAEQDDSWVYSVPCPIPARCMVLAIGQFDIFVSKQAASALRNVAESLAPVEDGGGPAADTAGGPRPEPTVTSFAATGTPSAALLESTCEALPLLQSLTEQVLQCRLPWAMYSLVFVAGELCQVRLRACRRARRHLPGSPHAATLTCATAHRPPALLHLCLATRYRMCIACTRRCVLVCVATGAATQCMRLYCCYVHVPHA